METYILVTPRSANLVELVKTIGRLKKTRVIVIDEKNQNDISRLIHMGFQFPGPSLIVMNSLEDRPLQISGENEIVKYVREVQYKVVF